MTRDSLQSQTKEVILLGDCYVNYDKSNDYRKFKSTQWI